MSGAVCCWVEKRESANYYAPFAAFVLLPSSCSAGVLFASNIWFIIILIGSVL